MLINTRAYGKINIDERQEIFFPYGILGFEKLKSYALIDARQPPFYWLQSLDVQEIAFVLLNPTIFRPDYKLEVPKEELEEIEISNEDDMLVLSIVNVPANSSEMSANLQGPIIINRKKRIGRQSISLNNEWKVKHFILKELEKVKA